ncbi:MAG: hypothetical protein JSV03_10390 [Planctomycetota bacterium]|nr:MAG: hypothetical protein JSV03_10390 [Planctomycetota bacterium]
MKYFGLSGRCGRVETMRWMMVVWLLGLAAGCGYSTQSLHRKTVNTVYVEMFQSKEFRRGIEFQLTEALRKQIDRATPYKNARREKADTVLSGEVLEWREATIGRSFITTLPRETAATLAIRYRWQDVRTGKLLVDQPRLVTTIQYVRPVGETTFDAREDAVNKLARKVVNSMETGW